MKSVGDLIRFLSEDEISLGRRDRSRWLSCSPWPRRCSRNTHGLDVLEPESASRSRDTKVDRIFQILYIAGSTKEPADDRHHINIVM